MKTLEDLLGDRDAIAAVQTLLAHGFGPDVIAEAVTVFAAHGMRRSNDTGLGYALGRVGLRSTPAGLVECSPHAEPSEFCERERA